MKYIYNDLNKTIEKIIKLRIDDIIEKSDLSEKISNNIKNTNDIIVKDIKTVKEKKVKSNIKKHFTGYICFIKDVTNIIKSKPSLKYLSNDIVSQIETYKYKNAREQFKEFGNIWKNLDNKTKDKYNRLCQDKNFTNEKYEEIVNKSNVLKKKKSKESLK